MTETRKRGNLRWLTQSVAVPLILLWAILRVARFALGVPLALVSGSIAWMLHGSWDWPGWRSVWR